MRILFFILVFCLNNPLYSFLKIPPISGSYCTVDDYDFDEFRYSEQIPHCRRNVFTRRKKAICIRDGVYNRDSYTVDHLIPLSLSGSNHDDNLWCQHKSINHTALEYEMYKAVRDGEMLRDNAVNLLLDVKFNRVDCPICHHLSN